MHRTGDNSGHVIIPSLKETTRYARKNEAVLGAVAREQGLKGVCALMRDSTGVSWPRFEENARAYLLLSVTADAQAWVGGYEPDEYERIAGCMIDVLLGGVATRRSAWHPARLDVLTHAQESDAA
jgi:hypothetical protein